MPASNNQKLKPLAKIIVIKVSRNSDRQIRIESLDSGLYGALSSIGPELSYTATVLGIFILAGLIAFLIVPLAISEAQQAIQIIPRSLTQLAAYLDQTNWGKYLEHTAHRVVRASQVGSRINILISDAGTAVEDAVIILVIGLYGTLNARKYSNGFLIQAAIPALGDIDAVNDAVQKNANDRQEFFNQAMERAIKPIDSDANFVMMNTLHSANEVIEHFRHNNILIGRRFPPMETHIRVSLGLPEQMAAFWKAWDALPYPKTLRHP